MKKSPLTYLAIFFIKVYKYTISPIIGNQCRFTPSCSSYALEAYQVHGFIKGSYLMVKRILKCHPWGGRGYDPVPQLQEEKVKTK